MRHLRCLKKKSGEQVGKWTKEWKRNLTKKVQVTEAKDRKIFINNQMLDIDKGFLNYKVQNLKRFLCGVLAKISLSYKTSFITSRVSGNQQPHTLLVGVILVMRIYP